MGLERGAFLMRKNHSWLAVAGGNLPLAEIRCRRDIL